MHELGEDRVERVGRERGVVRGEDKRAEDSEHEHAQQRRREHEPEEEGGRRPEPSCEEEHLHVS